MRPPRAVAAPEARSIEYSDDVLDPAGCSTAYAALPVPAMSNPAFGVASRPRAPTVFSVPLFGGAWVTSTSWAVSMSYSVVPVAGSLSLFVYAAAVAVGLSPAFTSPAAYARFVSVAASAPLTGFSRRFSSASLITRMRSTVGLKSNPNDAPMLARRPPTAVAVADLALGARSTV